MAGRIGRGTRIDYYDRMRVVILYHWTALNRQVVILETVAELTP
jgi:hypothetical protein